MLDGTSAVVCPPSPPPDTDVETYFFFVWPSLQASWQSLMFLPTYRNGEVLSLEQMILEDPDFMSHSSFKVYIHQDFTKQILKKARVCFLQIHFYLAFFFAPSSRGLRLYHCTVAVTKAAFNLHLPDKPAVGEWGLAEHHSVLAFLSSESGHCHEEPTGTYRNLLTCLWFSVLPL